jgi:hypothetical protein
MQRIRALLDEASVLRHFVNERAFAYGSLFGDCGLLMSLATINLAMGRAYFEAGRARDVSRLIGLEGELHQIAQVFHACVGSGYIDGAFDKVLWRLHDPRFPLRLLPPYAGAAESAADSFVAFLRERYPHWAPEAQTA